jgi:HD-like signal output (HDOD) protein/HPt (histidine-containing phosphotransfer) domain-containing protein
MDNELLDIFTSRLHTDLPFMHELVSDLEADKTDATAKLFRLFHNYKSSASYLGLDKFHQLISQGENILSALRTYHQKVNENDIKWLQSCVSQLIHWHRQLVEEEPLSAIDESLFPTIGVIDSAEKTSDIMKGLRILYADTNANRAKATKAPLGHIFKTVQTTGDIDQIKTHVLENSIDIVILNMNDQSVQIAQELLRLKPDLPLITAIADLKPYQKSRLLLNGMTHPIASPIQSSDLKRHLHNIVTSYFSKLYTVISHEKIYNFIQGLDPLPSSVKKISSLCDDPESSIKEVVATVESDAISTVNILNAAGSPMYGIKKTSSVEKAVTAFGKQLVKAITLSDLACRLGSLQLNAYGINEQQFKETSALRLALMKNWYSSVNSTDLNILCSSAILGNLGMILIDQEICNEGLDETFKRYSEDELLQAEVTLLKTSSAFVTADTLEFWGLESDLIDSIRYCDSPFNAGDPYIQKLACANAVVYGMVTPYGRLHESIPHHVKSLMLKAGLELSVLEEAVLKVKSR